MSEEQYCLETIRILQQDYQRAIQPYIARLVYLRSMDTQTHFFQMSSIDPEILKLLEPKNKIS